MKVECNREAGLGCIFQYERMITVACAKLSVDLSKNETLSTVVTCQCCYIVYLESDQSWPKSRRTSDC